MEGKNFFFYTRAECLEKMLRLIHVINFAIIRLNEAERMVEEKDLVALFQF